MRRPNRLTGDVPPPPALICDGGGTVPPDILAVELDDATAAYVCAVQPAFDLLRQAAGQLAGLLVLSVACARNAGAHPMLELACEAEAEGARYDPGGRHILSAAGGPPSPPYAVSQPVAHGSTRFGQAGPPPRR